MKDGLWQRSRAHLLQPGPGTTTKTPLTSSLPTSSRPRRHTWSEHAMVPLRATSWYIAPSPLRRLLDGPVPSCHRDGNARNQRRRGAPVNVWACLLARRSLGTRLGHAAGVLRSAQTTALWPRPATHSTPPPTCKRPTYPPPRPRLTRNWPRQQGQHANALTARRLCASANVINSRRVIRQFTQQLPSAARCG